MHHYITNVIIYFLILVFMYVIFLRETIMEGKKGLGIKKTVDKTKDKVGNVVEVAKDKVGNVVEVAKDSYNTVKDATTEIAGDVIGAVGGILGDALAKLLTAVNKLDGTFASM